MEAAVMYRLGVKGRRSGREEGGVVKPEGSVAVPCAGHPFSEEYSPLGVLL